VFGDVHGNAIHLGERDCSVQRRHQKLIEEAPSPAVTPELRARMGAIAVNAIKSIGYQGAGTLEFLLDRNGEFYFMEMNTRLQVEHPITEEVVGVDLVEAQLKIAAGEGIPFEQSDLKQTGWAIECRINAEEPEKDFRPAIGRIGRLRSPEGEGVRFDAGIVEGQAVTPAFDSMLAKLITYGATRAEAVSRMEKALTELVLLGVPNNIDYLARIMRNAEFLSGKLHTGFLPQEAERLAAPEPSPDEQIAAVLAAAFLDVDFRRIVYAIPEPYASIGFWRN
jgi:acetyl/propionyl-CoA carboxylase alpha subunit